MDPSSPSSVPPFPSADKIVGAENVGGNGGRREIGVIAKARIGDTFSSGLPTFRYFGATLPPELQAGRPSFGHLGLSFSSSMG